MTDEIASFRDFARRCRELAETAHQTTANTLLDLANHYEDRADELERKAATGR